jgi:hypothetical protein
MMKAFTTMLVIAFLLCLSGPGSTQDKPMIGPDEMCKAELDQAACTRIQGWLEGYAHFYTVVEGVAFATYKNAQNGNLSVILRCGDKDGNEYILKVQLINNKITAIIVERTGGRVIKS